MLGGLAAQSGRADSVKYGRAFRLLLPASVLQQFFGGTIAKRYAAFTIAGPGARCAEPI
jgi:hypothetical protein